MLHDRPYMRDPALGRKPSMVLILIGINVGVFLLDTVIQVIMGVAPGSADYLVPQWFALSADHLFSGKLWTLVSYGFLHAGLFHLLMNMLLVFFIGRLVEDRIGSERFSALYFFGILLGGVVFIALAVAKPLFPWLDLPAGFAFQQTVVGASAAALAVLTFFCLTNMERPITLLLFFVLPVTVKPKWVLWFTLGMTLFGFIFGEILGRSPDTVSHSAHLGGMLAGYLYLRFGLERGIGLSFASLRKLLPKTKPRTRGQEPTWTKKKPAGADKTKNYTVNIGDKKGLQSEVDRILDKINEKGFGSLTPEEKKILDRARDAMSRS